MVKYPNIWLNSEIPSTICRIIISKYLAQNNLKSILIDYSSGRGMVVDAIPE